MVKKVALLIGVSEYGEGIPSLSAPLNDVVAMKRVLENPNMGGFDEVETLPNPDPTAMRIAIQQLFANCRKNDLVLLFFSGHGITDDNNRLYLATKGTSKDFYKATSVPASFIHDVSFDSYAKRQAIILDCCYSGAIAEVWQPKSVGLDLKQELGGEGRVVLTSSTATQTSFQQEGEELSLYTRYFIEGIETGAADQDEDGNIYARDLHEYAKAKVQEEKPKQKPGIIIDREGFNILLSQAPVNDPELDFRKLVEKYATEGKITAVGNRILRVKQQELKITEQRSDEIVDEVLAPYRKRLENIELYKEAYREAVEQNYPLTERLLNELQDLQNILGLGDKDVNKDRQRILAEKEPKLQSQRESQRQEQEEYQIKLQQYEQEFTTAIQAVYPLDKYVRDGLKNYQETLGLTDEDIAKIEQPILAEEETKYQAQQKYEERLSQSEQEAESAKQPEQQKQPENVTSQNQLIRLGIFPSKQALRRLLLGSTVMGGLSILISGGVSEGRSEVLFWGGNIGILVGSICVWLGSGAQRSFWLIRWTSRIFIWLSLLCLFMFANKYFTLGWVSGDEALFDFFLIVYLVCMYIGRW